MISKEEKIVLNLGKWLLLLLAFLILVFYFYNFYSTTVLTRESMAQFGDYFGGVLNPILGFATVSLLVWSIQVQLRELKLTRRELEQSTFANQKQAESLHKQVGLYEKKETLDSVKKELDMLNRRLNELLEIKMKIDKGGRLASFTLNEAFFNNSDDIKDQISSQLKQGLNASSSVLITLEKELELISNEFMFYFTKLVHLKEYEFSVVKLNRLVFQYRKIVEFGFLSVLQANYLAQYVSGLMSTLPDLKDEYLNKMKVESSSESNEIFNIINARQ